MSSRPTDVVTSQEARTAQGSTIGPEQDISDIVTFSLWRRLLINPSTATLYAAPIDAATRADIAKIKSELTQAAREAGKAPPEFELNIILLSDQKNEFSVTSADYQAVLAQLIEEITASLAAELVIVRSVYNDLDEEEKAYLDGLQAAGSAADMAKNKAIYRHRYRKHLQIDTNTKIPDFGELYAVTFGHLNEEARMRFNASYYDGTGQYVSVHNKAVYFTSGNEASVKFGETLQGIMTEYCREHKDDLGDKIPTKNSIYNKVFCEATYRAGLSLKAKFRDADGLQKERFVADIIGHPQEFGLTAVMLTALNQTWASDLSPPIIKSRQLDTAARYKSMPSVKFMSTTADYQVWENVIRKFFMDSERRLIGFSSLETDDRPTQIVHKEQYIQVFRSISNSARELAAAATFICNTAARNHPLFYHVLQMGFMEPHISFYEALDIDLQEEDVLNIVRAIKDKFDVLVARYDSNDATRAFEMPAAINEQFLEQAVKEAKEQYQKQVVSINTALATMPLEPAMIQSIIEEAGGLLLGIAAVAEAPAFPASVATVVVADVPTTDVVSADPTGSVHRPVLRSYSLQKATPSTAPSIPSDKTASKHENTP